jgi:hypothetical protein
VPFSLPDGIEDRPLLGLLHVGPPSNLILIKDGLPEYIRNYVLAHELAHFLTDIFFVRNLWLSALPDQAAEIIRAFSWQDYDDWIEFDAYIKGLPIRPSAIVARGRKQLPETSDKEWDADLIAREILAPWDEAVSIYKSCATRRDFLRVMCSKFGLPARIAFYYYDDIRQALIPPQDLFSTLFSPTPDLDTK